jgi:hypothetical protein
MSGGYKRWRRSTTPYIHHYSIFDGITIVVQLSNTSSENNMLCALANGFSSL